MKRIMLAPDERILTTGEVALRMHVDARTVVHWCDSGKLKYFRTPGGHRRIRLSDLTDAVNGAHQD
jgi:excisionase family DNA binding protein